ncbi:MAG: hypothetical protein KC983_10645, partial [Phycisphaerales bacterium]|nr:hypothetical protein [Phycisphaerales bacterium]
GGDSGDIIIDGTDGGTVIDTGGGSEDLIIGPNGDVTVIDLTVGGNVNGTLKVTNASPDELDGAVSITLAGSSVSADVTITEKRPTTITTLKPLTVTGNLTADHLVQSPLDLGAITVGGSTDISALGSNSIIAQIAGRATSIVADHGTDRAHLTIAPGVATPGTPITVNRLGGFELEPMIGVSANGKSVLLTPFARYSIIHRERIDGLVELECSIDFAALPGPIAGALRAAVLDDRATLATARRKVLAPAQFGPTLMALPLCSEAAPGCAQVVLLDANGFPTLSIDDATRIEFRTQLTSYSEWAVVVEDMVACPADFDGSGEVNFFDLDAMLGAWGACSGCHYDLNDDGGVNVDDVLDLISALGRCR